MLLMEKFSYELCLDESVTALQIVTRITQVTIVTGVTIYG